MKISTWNVNGLRALINKGAWTWFDEFNPDVICLQEIKARPDQLTQSQLTPLADYQQCWNPAERPGYSGVLTLTNSLDQTSIKGIGIDRFDTEGRTIQTSFQDFILYNIYFPNGGRDLSRVPYKLDFYAALLEICDQLHQDGKNIMICGDFNTAHQEIDLKNPRSNQQTTGFLPEERAWITRFLEHGFVDAYRSLYPDRIQYTWWTAITNARSRNVGWRLDYFLVSAPLMDRVSDVIIHDDIRGSDHCPVTLIFN